MLHCFCKCCYCCQWDDRRVVPANMSLELSELFARELTRVSVYIYLVVYLIGFFIAAFQ